jgi:RNA polymerase sigma-70 factor (ECF subfamily)
MRNQEIENQIDFLLSAALNKCGNLEDAQDLTQDTLLAALTYLSNGNPINDIRGWLLTVLNRKFYYKLRQKYKISIVSIGEETELTDETDYYESIGNSDEAESLRRAVAHLSKLHREVIVRYYMNRDSIEKIARELGTPQGTVKSRLSTGRKLLKKELDNMENYTKQSYEPVNLHIWFSGWSGVNGRPSSLTTGGLIAQNLLYLAYKEPITESELSKAIGIPAAYVEPIIKQLVDDELMRRIGDKVYTDFIITTKADREKYVPAQKQFFAENSNVFMKAIKEGLKKIKSLNFYSRFTVNQQNALDLYFMFNCLAGGIFNAFSKIYENVQTFPDRPDGGKWIAVGDLHSPSNESNPAGLSYSYAGRRNAILGNSSFYVYDPEGFTSKLYFRCCDVSISDDDMLKLLCYINSNSDEATFNTELLKAIPWLVECKILRYDEKKATLDIPVVSPDEWKKLSEIMHTVEAEFIIDIIDIFRKFLKDKKQTLPKHLNSVPLHKLYMGSHGILVMLAIRHAMQAGIIYDGNYDNPSGENQCPCPMIFVTDK